MNPREQIMRQIRAGRPMVVADGGTNIRPAEQAAQAQEPEQEQGLRIKKHRWGL